MKLASTITAIGAGLAAATLLTGCASSALWARKTYQPAERPHLALALSPDGQEVLVGYDERCGTARKVQRRAYWLFAYSAKTDHHTKPSFTNAVACDQLNPIPVIGLGETNATPATGYCAVANPNSRDFQLWRDGRAVRYYCLPVYDAAPPTTFWRVGLTPVAIATDAAMLAVSGIVAGANHP